MSKIDEIIAIADRLPPFPKVAQQVMKMIDREHVTASDLAEVIQYDATITANLLKLCNAAYFGLSRKVTSVDDALVVLGHSVLKDIIIASSSARFFQGRAGGGYMLEEGDLWKHAVAVAIMAKHLVSHFPEVDSGAAFTAGLLHDIGKRFMSSFVADDFKKIMAIGHSGEASFPEAERRVLGIDHSELGARILERWEFDEVMVEAVRRHHEESALEDGGLVSLVALSNVLVISMGIGVGADGLSFTLQGDALERFGIGPLALEGAMAAVFTELDKAEEIIRLVE